MNHQQNLFKNTRGWVSVVVAGLLFTACGGGGGASEPTPTPLPVAAPAIALFAGNLGGNGTIDGIGSAARLSATGYMATDNLGNVYVADRSSNTIRKITPAGVVTTLAGTPGVRGSTDGVGEAASFFNPTGVAVDGAGNVYVTEPGRRNTFVSVSIGGNNTIRKITPAGVVTTLAGDAGVVGSADGSGVAANFYDPVGIATDGAGNVYVADGANRTIRKITPAGVVATLAGTPGVFGSADGSGAVASFRNPNGLTSDSAGNLYVADNNTVRKITPLGVVSTLAGTPGVAGGADGSAAAASFSNLSGIAVDRAGNVYAANRLTVRKITPAGVVSTLDGPAGAIDTSLPTGDGYARGVATDNVGNVYVSDDSTIRKITPAGAVSTLAGMPLIAGSADGLGAAVTFNGPEGIASDREGNVYVADKSNRTIRKITPAGLVSTLAGKAGVDGDTDGSGAAARFGWLGGAGGMAADSAGNVYVADGSSIRKITPAGLVSTLAGKVIVFYGEDFSADGTGAAARFDAPQGVATDSVGNIYVADTYNHTIRKVTQAGVVTTLAGTARITGSANNSGAAARFNRPWGIATDRAGNVYVTDNYTIRKITPAGVVSTLAGKPQIVGSADGSGAGASFNEPRAIAVDGAGNVYVADTGNSTVRKITPEGMVSTLVGVPGRAAFAVGALPGGVAYPVGLAVSGSSLYITMANGVAVVTNLP